MSARFVLRNDLARYPQNAQCPQLQIVERQKLERHTFIREQRSSKYRRSTVANRVRD